MHIWVVEEQGLDGTWAFLHRYPTRAKAREHIKIWRKAFTGVKMRIRKYVREEV